MLIAHFYFSIYSRLVLKERIIIFPSKEYKNKKVRPVETLMVKESSF